MYETFYNLKVEPFRLSPDHRFCFSHKSYAKAKAYMQYAIHRAEGFVMVTGKPGTGKTTLVNDLVDGLSQSKIVVATIVSTQLEADDLLRLVACNFGLDVEAPNKAVVLQGLSVRLRRIQEEGTRALLIIDEAQDLSASALEELRLLTNLQLNNQPLLQIFLVGQENLRDLIQKPSMEQVHQRLVAACHLDSLSEQDTKAYIRHRLDRVGWREDPTIDEGVYPLVFHFSKGVPRRINLICSRFLLHGCVEEKHRIRAADVRTVVEELQQEQLTPAGFRTELPPLWDDEVAELPPADEHKPDAATVREPVRPRSAPLESNSVAEQPRTERDADVAQTRTERVIPERADRENPSATTPPLTATSREEEIEIAGICKLEERDARIDSEPGGTHEDHETDTIQENYFSLTDALELPSEPVPIRQPVESTANAHGYGDRFAKAQQQKLVADAGTHYYNEYRAGGRARGGGDRKFGLVGITVLFLIILAVVTVALYLERPPQFLGSTEKTRPDQGSTLPGLREGMAVVAPRQEAVQTDKGGKPAGIEATDPVPKGDGEAALPAPDRQPVSPGGQDDLSDNPPVTEQKKTVPRAELSPASPILAIPDAAGRGANVAKSESESESERTVETPTPMMAAARATVETLQSAPAAATPSTDADGQNAQAEPSTPRPVETPEPVNPPAERNQEPTFTEQSAVLEPLLVPSASEDGMSGSTVQAAYAPPTGKTVRSPPDTSKGRPLVESPRGTLTIPDRRQPVERQILFSSNSTVIEEGYNDLLAEVVEWLKNNSGDTARIVGYADNSGNRYYNLDLSFRRATAVAAYLEKKNIPKGRLHVEGRGVYPVVTKPSDKGATARHRQRLVKIVIVPPDR